MTNECQCFFCRYCNTNWRNFPCNVCMTGEKDYYKQERKGQATNEKTKYGNETNYKL